MQGRIETLTTRAAACGFAFRSQFIGKEVEILVEKNRIGSTQHGRCERYFDVHFEHEQILTGRAARIRVERVAPNRTFGTLVSVEGDNR